MRTILFSILLIILSSCEDKRKVPQGILPPEKMGPVMWDMLQADEFVKDFVMYKDTTLNDTAYLLGLYDKVFRIHKTSRGEFANSFHYYREHPLMMKEILDTLYNWSQREAPPEQYYRSPQQRDEVDTMTLRRLKKALPVE